MATRRKRYERLAIHAGGIGALLLMVLWCRFQGDTGVYDDSLGVLGKPFYRMYYLLHFLTDFASQRLLGTKTLTEAMRMAVCIGIAASLWAIGCLLYFSGRRLSARLWGNRAADPEDHASSEIRPVSRRAFFTEAASGTGAMMACGAAYPVALAPEAARITRYTLEIPQWPEALDGLRAVQLTDTHYGPMLSLGYLQRVVQQTNALQPDIVFLTGDYVHNHRRHIRDGIQVFSKLESRFGTLAVLGNHDHWIGLRETKANFEELGVPLIDNSRRFLSPDGLSDTISRDAVCIAGVDDLWTGEIDFEAALSGVPESMPRILLSHNPDVAELNNPYRVDAMFSGHTHGGQVCIPGIGALAYSTDFGDKYLAGVCPGPWTTAIVSRGIGVVSLPVRFNCPAEIVEVTFRRAVSEAPLSA
ncbi:MAG: hypothetical protein GC168_12295 [Candidatus Hydrogenedens sp.]|nr:hypothetical protein [Candidatus Hydrogenedens sp.]